VRGSLSAPRPRGRAAGDARHILPRGDLDVDIRLRRIISWRLNVLALLTTSAALLESHVPVERVKARKLTSYPALSREKRETLKISKQSLESMAAPKYRELTTRVHRLVNERGCQADFGPVESYVAKAVAYGLRDEVEVTVYVECALKIERSGYDMAKVERLMSDDELSRDHKLIPLRMLADHVGKGES